jgi:DNA-binding MarR family transcriptional regulator
MTTEKLFQEVYTRFKMHFYREVFRNFDNREATLTTVETFCMEVIYAMDNPTVNEFASFIKISSPNAAYKVNSLIRKGYLKKIRSEKDHREYHLQVTQKYLDYYNVSTGYVDQVLSRVKKTMSPEEWADFHHTLEIILSEQGNDVPPYGLEKHQEN